MNLRRITSLLGVLPLLALAANANHRAVLVVTSSVDYTPGCLRDMVASAAPGDVIKFGFPMITNLTAPIVVGVDNLTIEACYPDVVLNATALFPGLEFQGVTGCKVLGLRMEGFNGALIFANGANGNKVGGLNPCDRVEVHNGGNGIVLRDGGTSNNEFYNVVSRNNIYEGIYLRSGASYNQFGDGTYGGAVFSYANTLNGLLLQTTPAYVGAVEYNEFWHCLIGTDLTGYAASGNALSGVALSGTAVTNNSFTKCVLSGNAANGASISAGASLNKFTACHIGTDIDGKIALGNIVGVDIACGSQNSLDSLNVISGNYSDGVRIRSTASCLNLVNGNALGPDVNGNALGNGGSGIALLNGAWANQVTQNHISSNLGNGVLLFGNGVNANNVELNVVGTDQAASAAMPNGLHGILLDVGAFDNDFKENIVSGNTQYGIAIGALGCDGNEFKGNVVGLDNSRVNAIPNGAGGVLVLGSNNLFGGMTPNQGNYICANTGWGVEVRGPI
ncbi:MAG: right-handed parallel beta-helix repeat-containing protein, partial [Planctomycetes bacterium]|nr:right-handed parallel beta-helix repeat-containing protein [Planctomycetota bacterium]